MFIELVKKYKRNSIIMSCLMIILALCLIFMPLMTSITFTWLFGMFIIIDGLIHVFSYFKTDKDNRLMNFEFGEGLLEVVAGLFIIFDAVYLVIFLPFIIGAWIIIKSVLRMQIALNLKNAKQKDWALMFIFSIVFLILGVLIILDPIVGFFEITLPVIGTCIAIYEIINIIETAYVLKKMG